MLKSLSILALAAAFVAPAAFADQITGAIAASGSNQITSNTITFLDSTVGGESTGDFATYIDNGTAVNFAPGALPYSLGMNTAPGGSVQLFSVSDNGETFVFDIQNYTATQIACPANSGPNCAILSVFGNGAFTGSGAVAFDPTPGVFSFTTQLVNGQTTTTTFSASANASPVPEPSTLMLLGTGVFGAAGMIRRRMSAVATK